MWIRLHCIIKVKLCQVVFAIFRSHYVFNNNSARAFSKLQKNIHNKQYDV